MYTLRDVMEEDFVGTLKKVAEIGYEGVEFAGYGGLSKGLREVLEDTGLKSVGSHVSLEMLRDSLDEVIEMNKTIGTRYVVCPYLGDDCRNTGQMDKVAGILTRSGEELAKHGIGFGYHNHSFEFEIKVGDESVAISYKWLQDNYL
ncbi:sugar phosphate isomerase/epimerase [Paenibacillus larvae subsp. larvae]|uniref:Sugar phosphate isomerase/epimerase n=1 Tax=Paenibacillus larvae subsp. larvae TaxID=147375 RepID=A0A6C0QXK9_9BACL|nr:sugar phosphate isomerase/epimerase [Paenibacillus larvae subsp. larvae]